MEERIKIAWLRPEVKDEKAHRELVADFVLGFKGSNFCKVTETILIFAECENEEALFDFVIPASITYTEELAEKLRNWISNTEGNPGDLLDNGYYGYELNVGSIDQYDIYWLTTGIKYSRGI